MFLQIFFSKSINNIEQIKYLLITGYIHIYIYIPKLNICTNSITRRRSSQLNHFGKKLYYDMMRHRNSIYYKGFNLLHSAPHNNIYSKLYCALIKTKFYMLLQLICTNFFASNLFIYHDTAVRDN